jgi:hypothetical protein
MDVPGPVLRNATVPNPVSLRQSLPTPEIRDPAVLVDVLVLSADLLLFDAIRGAIGERNPVWRARSAEESVDLLLTGRCGVLLVDMAAWRTRRYSRARSATAVFTGSCTSRSRQSARACSCMRPSVVMSSYASRDLRSHCCRR